MTRILPVIAATLLIALRRRLGRDGQDHLHDPRRGLRPRRRDEPVRRHGLRPAGRAAPPRSSPTTTRAPRSGRPTRTSRSACCSSRRPRRRGSRARAQAGSRKLDPSVTYTLKRRGISQVDLSASGRRLATFTAPLQVAGDGGVTALGGQGRYRGVLEFAPNVFNGLAGHQLGRAGGLPAGRRARGVARVVAGRGAQGAGDRRPHVRDHDGQERRLRPLRRHALAGLQGRRDRGRLDQRGDRRHARADRHLPGPAGRHLLLLDLGRAHRGRSRTRRWATSRSRG